jgi:hypothetical protein
VFSFRDLQTLNIKNMKQRKTMRQWWREQLADFRELADRLELKQGLQQFAVGALMGTCLILVCCAAEWLESLCN